MATAAFCWAVQRALPPTWSKPSPCSSAGSTRAAGPSAAAPPRRGPWPPPPAVGAPPCPLAGSAWGASHNSSRPATPSNTAALRAGLVHAKRRPPAPGARNHANASAGTTPATASVHTKPSLCKPRPHALRALRMYGPPLCHRWRILTASRCATSAPTVAAGAIIAGSTWHTPALAKPSASRPSPMASGMSPLVRANLAGCANGTCASRRRMGDANDAGDCCPCLRTLLLPISPAGHSRLAYCSTGLDFPLQPLPQHIHGHVEVIIRLQPQPELRRGAKVPGQPERCLSSDAPLPEHDLVNAPRVHPMSNARRFWLRCMGLRNSSSKTSPGCTGCSLSSFMMILSEW